MISPLLKIATLALICSISFAGIHSDVTGPEYENKWFDSRYICDSTKPAEFPEAYKASFNCTQFAVLSNGNYICNDNPCVYVNMDNPVASCVWQTSPFLWIKTLGFLDQSHPKYDLKPCHRCFAGTCGGRYTTDKQICPGGELRTNTFGDTWICQNSKCNSDLKQMKMQADGTYACVDLTCTTAMIYDDNTESWKCPIEPTSPSSAGTFIPWAIVALLSGAVIYLAYQKRTKSSQNSALYEN